MQDTLSNLPERNAFLAAIIASTDDAIISKDLRGRITSWNVGAEKLLGYKHHEIVGENVMLLIPQDRAQEEPEILARIARGERLKHYETVRLRKDGSRVEVSLTVSPIIDPQKRVIGASKILRDITERKRAELSQRLLIDEINHRVKNYADDRTIDRRTNVADCQRPPTFRPEFPCKSSSSLSRAQSID